MPHAPRRLLFARSTAAFASGVCEYGVTAHVVSAEADLPELVADEPWRPCGFSLVAGAQVEQAAIGLCAQVYAVDRAEGSERGMPAGAGLGGVDGLRADRLARVLVAVHLAVGRHLGGPVLPFQPVQRLIRDGSEHRGRPDRLSLGGEPAETPVRSSIAAATAATLLAAGGVLDVRDLISPWAGVLRDK